MDQRKLKDKMLLFWTKLRRKNMVKIVIDTNDCLITRRQYE